MPAAHFGSNGMNSITFWLALCLFVGGDLWVPGIIKHGCQCRRRRTTAHVPLLVPAVFGCGRTRGGSLRGSLLGAFLLLLLLLLLCPPLFSSYGDTLTSSSTHPRTSAVLTRSFRRRGTACSLRSNSFHGSYRSIEMGSLGTEFFKNPLRIHITSWSPS
jgi:hypothetical protein